MQNLKDKIAQLAANADKDEKGILFELKKLIYQAEMELAKAKESKQLAELIAECNEAVSNENQLVIKSGYRDLDQLIGGFSPGEFVVFGARPGMGKTQLLVNLSLNMAKEHGVQYFSFDLSEFLLTSRFISASSGIAMDKITQRKLTAEDKEKIKRCEIELNEYQLYVNDGFNTSLSAFKAHCEKQIKEKNVKVIMVDYMQMMSSFKFRNNREMEIGVVSRELKNIARDNNVVVIAASQLSRAVETRGGDKRPVLSDLRESGAIEQDADKVFFIYRADYYGLIEDEFGMPTDGVMELIIAKNRSGTLDRVQLQRAHNFTKISDFDLSAAQRNFSFTQDRLDEIDDVPF